MSSCGKTQQLTMLLGSGVQIDEEVQYGRQFRPSAFPGFEAIGFPLTDVALTHAKKSRHLSLSKAFGESGGVEVLAKGAKGFRGCWLGV